MLNNYSDQILTLTQKLLLIFMLISFLSSCNYQIEVVDDKGKKVKDAKLSFSRTWSLDPSGKSSPKTFKTEGTTDHNGQYSFMAFLGEGFFLKADKPGYYLTWYGYPKEKQIQVVLKKKRHLVLMHAKEAYIKISSNLPMIYQQVKLLSLMGLEKMRISFLLYYRIHDGIMPGK